MRAISPRAVLAGTAMNVAMAVILIVLTTVIAFLMVKSPHRSAAEAEAIAFHSWAMLGVVSIGGLCAAVFGGYTSALIAGRDEILHGALAGILILAYGLVELLHGHRSNDQVPQSLGFALDFAGPLFGALGGWLRLHEKTIEKSPPRMREVSRWLLALPVAEIVFVTVVALLAHAVVSEGAKGMGTWIMAFSAIFGIAVGALCAPPRHRLAAAAVCFVSFLALPLLMFAQALAEHRAVGGYLVAVAGVLLGGLVLRRSFARLAQSGTSRLGSEAGS